MERRPRVWRKEKLAGSGKPERKMPLSTMEKFRGGTKRSSPSSLSEAPSPVVCERVWSVIVSWIWRHIGVSWWWWVCWSSAATCISKFVFEVVFFCFRMIQREREGEVIFLIIISIESMWMRESLYIRIMEVVTEKGIKKDIP